MAQNKKKQKKRWQRNSNKTGTKRKLHDRLWNVSGEIYTHKTHFKYDQIESTLPK